MDITGKVTAVLPEQGGTSKSGNEWKKQEYVIETHEQYPKHICFQLFGADRIANAAIKMGEELTVSVDIDAHEYNGRWYNSISGWKVARAADAAPQPQAAPSVILSAAAATSPIGPNLQSAPKVDGAAELPSTDDLPF